MKSFTLTTVDILVSGNFVVEIGTYNLVVGMPAYLEGDFLDKGKYLTLFEVQKDRSLLIKADTLNTDFNPWERIKENYTEEHDVNNKNEINLRNGFNYIEVIHILLK